MVNREYNPTGAPFAAAAVSFFRTRRVSLLVRAVTLIFFLLSNYSWANVGGSFLESLDRLVFIERVPISPEIDALSKDILYFYYENWPYRITDSYAYRRYSREELLRGIPVNEWGYEFDGLGDYVFVRLHKDSYGAAAIYKPKSGSLDPDCDKYIHDMGVGDPGHYMGDLEVLREITGIFRNSTFFEKGGDLKHGAFISLYLYYWHYLTNSSVRGFYFGDPTDMIYVFDDPYYFVTTDIYRNAATYDAQFNTAPTKHILGLLPKGNIGNAGNEVPAGRRLFFYTWDKNLNMLQFWYFAMDGGKNLVIKQIMVGYL